MPHHLFVPGLTVPAGWESLGPSQQGTIFCPACGVAHGNAANCPDINARAVLVTIHKHHEDQRRAAMEAARKAEEDRFNAAVEAAVARRLAAGGA